MIERRPYVIFCTCGKIMGLSAIPNTTRMCPECLKWMWKSEDTSPPADGSTQKQAPEEKP